jgi:GxxExxY protein
MPLIDDAAVNQVTGAILDAAIEVHRQLGPGLLESLYFHCLVFELNAAGLSLATKVSLPVVYKGTRMSGRYELDLIVGDMVVVEVKAVETLLPVHRFQLLTYLKLTGHPAGLLINFNVPLLKHGVKRVLNTR